MIRRKPEKGWGEFVSGTVSTMISPSDFRVSGLHIDWIHFDLIFVQDEICSFNLPLHMSLQVHVPFIEEPVSSSVYTFGYLIENPLAEDVWIHFSVLCALQFVCTSYLCP
jgi:hypothetical protein